MAQPALSAQTASGTMFRVGVMNNDRTNFTVGLALIA